MQAVGGRRVTPGSKVLKDRRSPRGRVRTGTSVVKENAPEGSDVTADRATAISVDIAFTTTAAEDASDLSTSTSPKPSAPSAPKGGFESSAPSTHIFLDAATFSTTSAHAAAHAFTTNARGSLAAPPTEDKTSTDAPATSFSPKHHAASAATSAMRATSSPTARARATRCPAATANAAFAARRRASSSFLWVKRSVSRTSYRSNVEREARVKSDDGKSP